MAKYPVAARYDAVNLEGNFWKYYLTGVFLAPVKVLLFFSISFISYVWA
jgi:hypothetical protein